MNTKPERVPCHHCGFPVLVDAHGKGICPQCGEVVTAPVEPKGEKTE